MKKCGAAEYGGRQISTRHPPNLHPVVRRSRCGRWNWTGGSHVAATYMSQSRAS